MIHLTNEQYDNLLRQIEKGTEFTIQYLKERNEQKQRADELEKQLNSLKEYIPSLRSAVESTLYYSHPDIEPNLQSDISSYSSLMEQICKELQEDDNARSK